MLRRTVRRRRRHGAAELIAECVDTKQMQLQISEKRRSDLRIWMRLCERAEATFLKWEKKTQTLGTDGQRQVFQRAERLGRTGLAGTTGCRHWECFGCRLVHVGVLEAAQREAEAPPAVQRQLL